MALPRAAVLAVAAAVAVAVATVLMWATLQADRGGLLELVSSGLAPDDSGGGGGGSALYDGAAAAGIPEDVVDWNALEARAAASALCQRRRGVGVSDGVGVGGGGGAALAPTAENATWSTHWIVITSINLPTLAVAKLAAQSGWRVVVVGDRKTPATWEHPNCVFLSLDAQRALGYRILAHVPERSYARKNIGYLYAIEHGAQVIYETDDDNLLTDPRLTLLAGSAQTQRLVRAPSVERHSVYNVYAHFGQPTVWPRGYPLDAIADGPGADPATAVLGPGADTVVGIEQGLADGDPDVDAIFRLTRKNRESPIDIAFARDASPLVLPPFTFSPFNSQNTVFHAPALWATLIPTTTTFRVCDIWRGYWAQRLLWEAGATLLFREPNVRQDRNVHDYHKDFLDELDLYKDAGRLVRFLRDWRAPPEADHLFERIDALTIAMVREGFWLAGDAHLVRAWLRDLLDVCYVPPRPGGAEQTPVPAFAAPIAAATQMPGTTTTPTPTTTVLGCGNKCALVPTVPTYLWDDVAVYTVTSPDRHRTMRIVRHTWARHLPRPLTVFTTGQNDPYVPTTLVPDPHPSWTARDATSLAAYVGEVVPLLLALEPPAQFFIHVDDATLPVLSNIHAWLADYRARHAGRYPDYVLDAQPLAYRGQEHHYQEQAAAAAAQFAGIDGHFPGGGLYGYSRGFLEELLPVARSCPVLDPSSAHFGALVACARVDLPEAQIADRANRTLSPGFARTTTAAPEAFDRQTPLDHPTATFYYGGIRQEAAMRDAYRAVYGQGLGIPEDPVVGRILAGWDGRR